MDRITRQDLLDGKATPDDYYDQFVTDSMEGAVLHVFGSKRLKASFAKDSRMQDITALEWLEARPYPGWKETVDAMHEAGDEMTVAAGILILKAAARRVIRRYKPD